MRTSPPQTDLRRTWGRAVRALRMQAQLTQDQVATALGIALKAYQRLESGKHNPTLDTIGRVAVVLGQPVARFFAETATPAGVQFAQPQPTLPSAWRYAGRAEPGIAVFGVYDQAGVDAEEQPVQQLGRALPPRGRRLTSEDLFLLQARGDSMQPRIQPGDWLLWRRPVQQPWFGKTVLVQAAEAHTPDTGRWWVKRLTGMEQTASGAVRLRLESMAPDHPVLWREGCSDADLGLLAELVEVLGPPISG